MYNQSALEGRLRQPGSIMSNPNRAIGGTVTALTPSADITIDASLGDVFTLVPEETGDINVENVLAGQRLVLIVTTSGTSSFTLTFADNFRATATLATGTTSARTFVLEFICDGTDYIEMSRTAAIA